MEESGVFGVCKGREIEEGKVEAASSMADVAAI